MATKNTTKKTQAKPKAPIKLKSKAPIKKKQTSTLKRSAVTIKPEQRPFMSMQPNRETLYWIVLGIVVVTFGVWINALQTDIQSIYDQIDASVVDESAQILPIKQ